MIKSGSPIQTQAMPMMSMKSTKPALDMKFNICISEFSTGFPEVFMVDSMLVIYGSIGK